MVVILNISLLKGACTSSTLEKIQFVIPLRLKLSGTNMGKVVINKSTFTSHILTLLEAISWGLFRGTKADYERIKKQDSYYIIKMEIS